MTFDVNELPGRAQALKAKGIEMYKKLGDYMSQQNPGPDGPQDGMGYYPGVGYYSEDQIDDAANRAFAGVENIYDRFVSIPAPEDFVGTTDNLKKAMGYLATSAYSNDPAGGGSLMTPANTALTGVATSGGYMADWTGDAAETYQANFAANFGPVTSSQFTLTSVLRQAVNAEAAIWQTVRDDLDKLSTDAMSKMEQCDDKSPSDWSMILTVAAAVVSIAAVPATGGGSVALYFAIAGAGIGVAATGIGAIGDGPAPDQFGLETGDPLKIIEGVNSALSKINGHIVDAENTIARQMNATSSAIAANMQELCLPKPNLADADNGHRYNDPRYLGQSNG